MDDRDQFEQRVAKVRGDILHALESTPTVKENAGVTVAALAEVTLNLSLKWCGRQGTVDLFREVIRSVPQ